ncbi:trimethylamine methyltransferase family protein [Parasedimentitalea psychrophila]|uniref:Trimethylamine methyltransferase family protein n=1 Tax=Parasedimentitalea psychrophila TaxID=2997337 RepID=A0A9Y2P5W2_9RHOB|nr:trimethylamine methyltransferase family protein [Parasedimentitalea psychrophila]WIY24378.1 trimethylamine methyltransferase family protein [Parasedimentitalea psychrophila]
MQHFSFLEDHEVKRIHDASLEILAQTGLLVRNKKARDRFAEHGANVDEPNEMVRIPPEVVERYLALVPPTITLRGRDPKYDVTFPRKLPVVATASSAPDIVDPVSGVTRRATSDDIARIAHVVNELDGFDVFSISVLADDAPDGHFNLSRFYPALKNCLKPVRTSVVNVEEAKKILKLGELVAGSPEAFWKRPFINFGYCSIVTPLTMDFDSTENLMFFAENGITAYGTVAPMGGINTPLSLPGMMTLINAEWLATMCLAQMSRAGTELIYNFLPVFADLRDGAYAPGAIEVGMMNSIVCQMARRYNVPAGGYLGLTNSKISDAQAGYEKSMSPLLGALSGVNFVVMGGLLDALMSLDFGQLAIDNEIACMIKRVREGVTFNEDTIALDDIKRIGPAGMFADAPMTLENMTTATFMPELADRDLRETWMENGSSTIHQRALNKAMAILSSPNHAALDAETDQRIKAHFQGIVAGDSTLPVGWKPFAIGGEKPQRARRQNRRSKKKMQV